MTIITTLFGILAALYILSLGFYIFENWKRGEGNETSR